MQYEILLDARGALTLNGAPNNEINLWSGDVILGRVEPNSLGHCLHAMANNIEMISRYGLTLSSSDFAVKHSVRANSFLEWYSGKNSLIAQLQTMIGPNKWTVYSIGISGSGQITANFGIVIPLALKDHKFIIRCNGKAMDDAFFTLDPHLATSHWFMPNASVLGCRAIFDGVPITDILEFTISFSGHDTPLGEKFLSLLSYTNPALLGGLPDVARIRRVSGPVANQNSFLNGGMTAAQHISTLISKYYPHDGSKRVLDWGVGCGRVAIHLSRRPDMIMSGIDIDRDNLEWCQNNLAGRYEVVDLLPPIPFDDHSFDVIYSCSVLSHLTAEVAHAWLDELARVLEPNGIALLSFNGNANLASYLGRRPLKLQQALKDGFFDGDINHDLDGFIPSKEYYRASFATTAWWKSVFQQHFDLIEIEPSVVSGYQDIAVLRRR